jgi:Ca2+-binding EF-hand superfamily protein
MLNSLHIEFVSYSHVLQIATPLSTSRPTQVSSLAKQPVGFDPSLYATKNLPAEDVAKLKECFDIFDYDKSGNVSAEELATAIKALGLEKEASKILHIVSMQSSETEMDFETFLQIFGFNGDSQSESNLQSLFEIFDKNGVGSFGVEEFT